MSFIVDGCSSVECRVILTRLAFPHTSQQQQLALTKLNAQAAASTAGGSTLTNGANANNPLIPISSDANQHAAIPSSQMQQKPQHPEAIPPPQQQQIQTRNGIINNNTTKTLSNSSALYPQESSDQQQPPATLAQQSNTQRRTSVGRPVHPARPVGSTAAALAAQQLSQQDVQQQQVPLQQAVASNQANHVSSNQTQQQPTSKSTRNTQRTGANNRRSGRTLQSQVPSYLQNVKVIRGGFDSSNTLIPTKDGSLHHANSATSLSSSLISNSMLNPAQLINAPAQAVSISSNIAASTIHPKEGEAQLPGSNPASSPNQASNPVHRGAGGGLPMFPRPPTGSVISMSSHGGRMRKKEVTMQYFGLGKPLPHAASRPSNSRSTSTSNQQQNQQALLPSKISDHEDFNRGDFLESATSYRRESNSSSRSNSNTTGLGLAPHRQHWKVSLVANGTLSLTVQKYLITIPILSTEISARCINNNMYFLSFSIYILSKTPSLSNVWGDLLSRLQCKLCPIDWKLSTASTRNPFKSMSKLYEQGP